MQVVKNDSLIFPNFKAALEISRKLGKVIIDRGRDWHHFNDFFLSFCDL